MPVRFSTLFKPAILALLLVACSVNPQPAGLTPIPTLAPGATPTLVSAVQVAAAAVTPAAQATVDPAIGASIFMQNCAPCHGAQGEGITGPALRNNDFVKSQGDAQVFKTVANGRSGTAMPAWLQANGGKLNEAQINNVVAFLHSLQGVAPLPTATPVPTDTPQPTVANAPTPEPAQPSQPGGPGKAVTLTGDVARGKLVFGAVCSACHGPEGVQGVPNPGSDDGSVPVLNPIDSTIANSDPKAFATNVDLFVEHGSIPSGPAPQIMMPSFGDSKLLTDQQIADLIAYIMSLNSPQ